MSTEVLAKIGKLLAASEGEKTPEAQDAYYRKAFLLASQHNVELAKARAHVAKDEQREQPTQRQVRIGERGAKANAHLVNLFLAIARAHDLRSTIAHNSTYVNMFGMPSDQEMTEALYATLVVQMVESCNAYLKTGAYKQEERYRDVRKRDDCDGSWCYPRCNGKGHWYWTTELKRTDGRQARASFYEAFINRISMRLSEAQQEAEEMSRQADILAIENAPAGSEERQQAEATGTDLVLVQKREEVGAFYKQKSDARGSWKGSSSKSGSSAGRAAGDRAGRSARMSGARGIGGAGKAVGR